MDEKKRLSKKNVYFNWGAFFLPTIYGLWHKLYFWAVLGLIPYLNFVLAIVFGLRANELAWEQEKYKTEEEFSESQRKWNDCGIMIGWIILALGIIIGISLAK